MKQTYTVTVESLDAISKTKTMPSPSSQNEQHTKSAEACYNVIREEYEHTFIRSDKLDNKVYIALTFCAFIFLYTMDLIHSIVDFKLPSDVQQFVLVVIYLLMCVFTLGLFLYILIKLAQLLKPMRFQRIDSSFYVNNDVQLQDAFTVYSFTFVQYQRCINANNKELEKRFKDYSKCIICLVLIVVCLFILSVMKLFIK